MVGRTRVTVDRDLLDVLWFAAELRSTTGAQLPFDLTRRLEEAYQATVTMKNPGLRSYQRWFEVYLALTAEAGKGTPAAAVAEDAKGGAPR
jgi:hypothetical protein